MTSHLETVRLLLDKGTAKEHKDNVRGEGKVGLTVMCGATVG